MGNVIVVIAIVVATLPVTAQNWTAPRTPWGDPDLQGLWSSVQLLSVPIERPVKLGTKATLPATAAITATPPAFLITNEE